MSPVISKNIEIYNAKQFKESVSEPTSSNVYITFGRSTAWPNEASPPQANTTVNAFREIWKNMIGAKRIIGNEIRHVIPRFDWSANTVYYAYDDRTEPSVLMNGTNQFYILTDEWNVYKCLSNNYGSNSTTKPTSTSTTSAIQTLDGYIWKYMYSLTVEERQRFLLSSYMPVRYVEGDDASTQYTIQQNSIDGAIDTILLTNFGSGYTSDNISVTIVGDGSDANAFATRNVTTNTISSITMDDVGSGYTYATVTITSDAGSSAAARAILPPDGGHGHNALKELGGSYLIVCPKIQNTQDGILTVANDYRQIALIEDPLVYGTTTISSNIAASQLMVLTMNGISAEFQEDEIVYQGASLDTATFKGTVVEWDSSNNTIKLSDTSGTPTTALLSGYSTGAARFVDSVTYPDLKPYSGNLLYMDNIQAIERASDQSETFQIVLKF